MLIHRAPTSKHLPLPLYRRWGSSRPLAVALLSVTSPYTASAKTTAPAPTIHASTPGGVTTAGGHTAAGSGAYALDAYRLAERPALDGELDEGFYREARPAEGFTTIAPSVGEASAKTTAVYVAYDDEALYVGARLTGQPAGVTEQVTARDQVGNADWFGVSLNPYRDGVTAHNFVVTAAGGQVDSRFGADRRGTDLPWGDRSWDAVWASAVGRVDGGWTVEMRIPFSMLRFPKGSAQYWDINFERACAADGERSFWHPVDPTLQGSASQMGRLRNLHDIRPGVRLQLTPFVTGTANQQVLPKGYRGDAPGGITTGYGAGLDLQYGITEAYTLDMMLVPDFSSARSDDQVLNLGPAEVQFGEQRAFFREGTELFEKGGYFYSRRIGGGLLDRGALGNLREGETAGELPRQAQLLNAAKVSGRGRRGLGFGVLNAVERGESVTVTSGEGSERELDVHPLTNYTVVAVDQILPNNSSVALLNMTALRDGSAYDANLTALVYDLRTPDQQWGISGRGALAQRYARGETELGHQYELRAGKIGGRLTYGARYYVESDTYNPNDLGFLRFNNERSVQLSGAYRWVEPVGPFNAAGVNGGLWHARLFRPDDYVGTGLWMGANAQTRDFWRYGFGLNTQLGGTYDYQEARTPGRRIANAPSTRLRFDVRTDGRRPLSLRVGTEVGSDNDAARRQLLAASLRPTWRVTDQVSLRVGGRLDLRNDDIGYVGHNAAAVTELGLDAPSLTRIPQPRPNYRTVYEPVSPTAPAELPTGPAAAAIYLGERDVQTVELESAIGVALTPQTNISVRARHYWSAVAYGDFFELEESGHRGPTDYAGLDEEGAAAHDANFNAFSVDAAVQWRFAPGSDVLLNYRTQALYGGEAGAGYLDNLAALGQDPINNTVALKVIYWLDGAKLLKRPRERDGIEDPLLPDGHDGDFLSGGSETETLSGRGVSSFVSPISP